jgi:hypothetical protein
MTTNVSTTNDGSNYWTITVSSADAAFASKVTIHTFDTSADTANTHTDHSDVPDDTSPANYGGIEILASKTASPGNLQYGFGLAYRMIVT